MSIPSASPPTSESSAFVPEDMIGDTLITSVPFELPQGLQTETGQVYRYGQMRLATGADELAAQRAAQVMDSSAYGILVRLARVVTIAGWPGAKPANVDPHNSQPLSPDDLGNSFMPDLKHLLELYNALNPPDYGLSLLGETQAIPSISFIRR
ncbi:MAG: hypothetical protein F6K42_07325 [Leptolyngbya sp. SIO1D8]|nr:hypothetical protein [Leptolyngbya sp. SIO1D8]